MIDNTYVVYNWLIGLLSEGNINADLRTALCDDYSVF